MGTVNSQETSEVIAARIYAFIKDLMQKVGQDAGLEKEIEIAMHVMFFLYRGRLEETGLFAQEELLDLMRQAEISIFGFSNLTMNHLDYFTAEDEKINAVVLDSKVLTQVRS